MTRNRWARSRGAREPAELGKTLVDPADWYPADINGSEAWIYRLSAAEIAEIEAAVAGVEARGLDIKDITRDDFPLPTLAPALADVRAELLDGRGFAMIRGLPVARLTRSRAAAAFWGVGTYLGTAISQNGKGHLLGHVKDLDADYARVRGYMTRAHMAFHCDQCDFLALACLHPAKSGGEHMICSSVALYNEMLRRRPDLAIALGGQFYRSRSGEIPPGETEPWVRQPVFAFHEGYFAARGVSAAIEKAQALPGVPPLTDLEREAMRMFRDLAVELAVGIPFERGDVFYLFNHVTLHSRTAFEDWPEPERKRHLLRLWLTTRGARPLPREIARRSEGIHVDGTVPTAPLDVT
jgi:hypothetical protein